MKEKSTIDDEEVAQFSRLAGKWWDESGPFKPLHRINPLRVGYVRERVAEHFGVASGEWLVASKKEENDSPLTTSHSPLQGFALLDIGCGGGLMCEPLAKLGARVTGIDASKENIEAAKAHAAKSGLEIDYRCMTAEELLERGTWNVEREKEIHASPATCHVPRLFDIVLALEIIEHVADVPAFAAAACALVKPGGMIIFSTINRTAKSFALAIAAAEYILRLVPRGTHDWKKFVKPSELCRELRHNHIEVTHMTGMVMNPLDFKWRLEPKDVDVNYFVAGRK